MRKRLFAGMAGLGLIAIAGAAQATTYTSDGTLSDFTGLSNYATLSNFCCGDTSSPYTPTAATIASGIRVYGGGGLTGLDSSNDWILATFSGPVSSIRVFPNIDHLGASYDGYQYAIEGSNDLTSWTPLYNTLTATGSGEPFTIGTFTGTAPTTVNNVLTPGAGPGGTVGYIADFSFGGAYKYYAFGASTLAINSGNSDQELSGVAAIPEPGAWTLMLIGAGLTGASLRRRPRAATSAA